MKEENKINNSLFKKGIVIGILVLFIVVGILSKTNLKCSDNNNTSIDVNGYVNNLTTTYDFSQLNWTTSFGIDDGCAGGIATGTVVKDGRSIFWKNRHSSSSNNKPDWQSGLNYNYWVVSGYLGMNEVGLAMGNFKCYDLIDVENRDYPHTEIQGDGVNGLSTAIHRALGRYDTVGEAARFMAINCTYNGNYQVGIVSSEPGVGAVVSMMNYSGTIYSHITWVNNTWAHLANVHYCDWVTSGWAANDPNDNNDETIYDMCMDITTNGGINGDYLIDWQEICQRGGKNVSGKEKGSGTFSCAGEITKASCVSGFVAVSGNSSYNGSINMGWLAMGRQPLVGIWLPLGASYLASNSDIPSEFRAGGGIEDYVDVKVNYASIGGQGNNIYYCDKVREVQRYTDSNENYTFNAFDNLMETIMTSSDDDEAESRLKGFADNTMGIALYGYINNITITNNSPVVSDIPDQTIDEGESFTAINLDDYVYDPDNADDELIWTYSGNTELTVTIVDRVATITVPSPEWNGSETITFNVTDPGGKGDEDSAAFTVNPFNDPPEITNVIMITSDPLDTEPGFGWENISCTVTDDTAVDEVKLVLIGNTTTEYPMIKDGDDYYCNITISTADEYTYHIWANDTNRNENTSISQSFDLPLNADVNEDSSVGFVDIMMVAGKWGQTNPKNGWIRADVNNSGDVGFVDVMMVAGQ